MGVVTIGNIDENNRFASASLKSYLENAIPSSLLDAGPNVTITELGESHYGFFNGVEIHIDDSFALDQNGMPLIQEYQDPIGVYFHELTHWEFPGLAIDKAYHRNTNYSLDNLTDVQQIAREFAFRSLVLAQQEEYVGFWDPREFQRQQDMLEKLAQSDDPQAQKLALTEPKDIESLIANDPAVREFLGLESLKTPSQSTADDSGGDGIGGAISGAIGAIGSLLGGILDALGSLFGGDEEDTSDVTKPVVIDLSAGAAADQASDGLDFYGLYNSPVFFNSDEDAFRERTAWVGPNEGIVTHVSTAKDGATLFEIALTTAVKSQYGIEASTDMEALYLGFDKGIDLNGDGTITLAEGKGDGKIAAAEAESLGLKIWRDADMDGVVDTGEMVSFAEAGIDFIDLNATNIDELKKAQDGSGAEADDIIEARFSDGSCAGGPSGPAYDPINHRLAQSAGTLLSATATRRKRAGTIRAAASCRCARRPKSDLALQKAGLQAPYGPIKTTAPRVAAFC